MINMVDMGEMPEKTTTMPEAMPEGKKEKHYPTTYISTKKLSDAENYDVGDEIELHTINKVVGKRINEDKSMELTLEMRECGIMHKGDKKTMNEMGKEQYGKMKEMKNKHNAS